MRRKFRARFRKIANTISLWAGSAGVFVGAILIILIWASTGPWLEFSDTWQLIINTGTTIITFLMVFLIQNTQNRDTKAIQLKLDELIHSTKTARDTFVGLEELTDEELEELDKEFRKLSRTPASTKAFAKLHQRIEAEHVKRMTLRAHAGKMVGALLKPLTPKMPKK